MSILQLATTFEVVGSFTGYQIRRSHLENIPLRAPQPRHHYKANLITLLTTSQYPTITDTLESLLSIGDIIALSRTCSTLLPLYQIHLQLDTWDINKRLSLFVASPVEFRRRLAKAEGIISGGFALQFMDRVEWEGSDLDVCVRDGEEAERFCRYVEEVEGYDLACRKSGKYAWTEVVMVHQYDKEKDGKFIRLEIIVTRNHPVHSTLSTYTTALVNIIAGDYAYSLFPHATFVSRKTFPTRIPDYFNGVVLAKKYQDRGWTFVQKVPQGKKDRVTGELALGRRRIGDRYTWKMRLSPEMDDGVGDGAEGVEGVEFEIARCEDVGFGLEWLSVAAVAQEKE